MRGHYLNVSNETGGCRGGVGSRDGCGDYDLEIGQHKNASAEMIALCVHIDEITEYLKLKQDCPIAQMILRSYNKTVKEINENLAPQQAPAFTPAFFEPLSGTDERLL